MGGNPLGGMGGALNLEASVAEMAALAVLDDDFTDTFNLEQSPITRATPLPPPQPLGSSAERRASRGSGEQLGASASPANPSDIPEDLLCPISHELMVDPVLAADGHAYERQHIESWLARQQTSPLTGEPLGSAALLPCHALRKMAHAWKAERR